LLKNPFRIDALTISPIDRKVGDHAARFPANYGKCGHSILPSPAVDHEIATGGLFRRLLPEQGSGGKIARFKK
jgi:hypothetical protein